MLITNLRVFHDPRGRCSWRQSRQTLPAMRRVNTLAKYMYGPSREFVRLKKISFFCIYPAMPTRCNAAECRKTLIETYKLTTWTVHVLCTCVYSTQCRQSLPRLTSRTAPTFIVHKHVPLCLKEKEKKYISRWLFWWEINSF